MNHKVLYSYLGTNGHYINHDNPTIRKRTAAVLSRLVHSRRYVEDFRASYERNLQVFDDAARLLSADLCNGADCTVGDLVIYFCGPLWTDVQRGLEHEREDGRVELRLDRIANEMNSLFVWCEQQPAVRSEDMLVVLASSYFHLMTFGHLDERFVCELADETPLTIPDGKGNDPNRAARREGCACLVKYASDEPDALGNWWTVASDRPFSIGRYTDCDIIETDPCVSRRHCRIVGEGGRWLLEDQGSVHGSRVLREGRVVYDSARDGAEPFELEFGDHLVLAGASSYWFGALLADDRHARR